MSSQTDFVELRFPTDVAFGSSGGPERSTEIVTLGSGREHRNQKWANSRRRYDAGYGVKDLDALHRVIDFFEARRGPLIGFRFRDPLDWKSCAPLKTPSAADQFLGTGDGTTTDYQLVKNYGAGDQVYRREIRKPVSGSLTVAVDNITLQEGTDFTVDHSTGVVSFSNGSIPATGASVSAAFEFDVPVRFGSDQLSVSLAAFTAGEVPSIPLLEIVL